MIALTAEAAPPDDAASLVLGDNLANLLVNIIILCGIILGFALVAGLAFGGLRLLAQRLWPNRVFDRPERIDFISLHLTENPRQSAESNVSSSIKVG